MQLKITTIHNKVGITFDCIAIVYAPYNI